MKGFRLLVGVILAASVTLPVRAASGTVWSEVKDDVAYVHHDDAYFNCCPEMVFKIVPHPDTTGIIDIYERDLDTHPCDCMCYFDFTHKLEGLAPGTYTARVWEDNAWNTNEYELAGITWFKISQGPGSLSTLSLRSPCGGWSALKEEVPKEGLRVSGSTTVGRDVLINYGISQPGEVTIDIYDVAGNRVRNLEPGTQSAGQHSVSWNGLADSGEPVPRGIYFVRLRIDSRVRTLPLIVLR